MVTELEAKKYDLNLEAMVLDKCLVLAVNEGERYEGAIVKTINEIERVNKELAIIYLIERVILGPLPVLKPTIFLEGGEGEILKNAEKYYYEVEEPEVIKQLEIMKSEFIDEHKKIQATKQKADHSLITDFMIQRARATPIDKLVEVKRGKALCPFHDDHNPSMSVKNNLFHCFVCGASGDSIRFVMKMYDLNFFEAVKTLNA